MLFHASSHCMSCYLISLLSAAVHTENRAGAENVCKVRAPGIDRLSASRGSDQFPREEGFSLRTTQVQ